MVSRGGRRVFARRANSDVGGRLPPSREKKRDERRAVFEKSAYKVMVRQSMESNGIEPGTLYIVATPIGNLGDMTERALYVLSHVDLVLCEDTRHSGQLLEHFGIRGRLLSYFAHNEALRTDQILPKLREGGSAAVITDAGTPGISDPGARLVDASIEAGVRVCPVPGASAVVSAVSASGFYRETGFEFVAFFPRKTSERQALFRRCCDRPVLLVGYESPQRIESLLADLESVVGAGRRVCMCRELTKKFETIVRDTVGGLRLRLRETPARGEICLVIEGADAVRDAGEGLSVEARKLADILVSRGLGARDVRDIVSEVYGCRPRLVYQYVLESAPKAVSGEKSEQGVGEDA